MFDFRPFDERDLATFRQWLNADHIKEFWQETDDDAKLKEKFLEDLPKRNVSAFIIEKEGTQIGYIQYYDATKVGGGWWEKEAMGTFGIDLMIGIPDMIGRGVGSKIISEFIEFLKKTEPDLKSVIIDPDPRNKRAIRAFEKAGFILESEILTPGGPALLMRRRVSKP